MREGGFTLMETLVVLSVTITLMTIGATVQVHVMDEYRTEQFFKQFQMDVLYMQQHTTTTSELLYLNFNPTLRYYEVKTAGIGKSILKRPLPKNWIVDMQTMKAITFSANGTIKNPGVFRIHSQTSTFLINFPFGKGRCYIVEI